MLQGWDFFMDVILPPWRNDEVSTCSHYNPIINRISSLETCRSIYPYWPDIRNIFIISIGFDIPPTTGHPAVWKQTSHVCTLRAWCPFLPRSDCSPFQQLQVLQQVHFGMEITTLGTIFFHFFFPVVPKRHDLPWTTQELTNFVTWILKIKLFISCVFRHT